MNDKQDRDRLDRLIDASAERLRTPVETPRDRMWERIAEARSANSHHRRQRSSWRSAASRWWPAAAAALLILGFGLGRVDWIVTERQVAQQEPDAAHDEAMVAATDVVQADWQSATGRMFLRAEALLASFDQKPDNAPMADPVPHWAGLLLYETRVLMDSPAAEDPELAALLDDLELVLAQITRLKNRTHPTFETDTTQDQADPARTLAARDDRAWISDGLAKRATLQRLRAHLDAGSL